MDEVLYDYPCSPTFREHERYWQGEGLYSEAIPPKPSPAPAVDYIFLERLACLERQVDSLKKGYHTHKKGTYPNKKDISL